MNRAITDAIAPIYEAVRVHPFVSGLTDGSLPEAAFEHYIVQDALFLADYGRALALCGARSGRSEDLRMFCSHATEAIDVERALHDELMADLGIDRAQAAAAEQSPACRAYTSFLLASCALEDAAVALASVVPCYWIYWEVGRELVSAGSPDPRYRQWIATYADDEFGTAVAGVVSACDQALGNAPPSVSERASQHAHVSARYEWMFWDSAFRAEKWPV